MARSVDRPSRIIGGIYGFEVVDTSMMYVEVTGA